MDLLPRLRGVLQAETKVMITYVYQMRRSAYEVESDVAGNVRFGISITRHPRTMRLSSMQRRTNDDDAAITY
jgi:hypothetical protein